MARRREDWTADVPVLLVTECGRCGNHSYLPREHCPVCGSDEATDVEAAGSGLCVAVTRLHGTADPVGPAEGPVRLALVELDEGPVVMGRVHDDALAPGDRAIVAFRPDGQEGVLVPSFAQAAPA